MASTPESTPRTRPSPPPPRPAGPARITPVFPLLLLETMRDRDRPEEVLEDEDVSVSLPRRLGLSDVVGVQIRRFQGEVKARRHQSSAQVEDLVRLVVRRPDSEEIFIEAGRRVASYFWENRPVATRRAIRVMPRYLAGVVAARAARRLFRRLTAGKMSVTRSPMELRIPASLTAAADPGGEACGFYAGAFGELLRQYTGRAYRVLHPECAARGGTGCVWKVELSS